MTARLHPIAITFVLVAASALAGPAALAQSAAPAGQPMGKLYACADLKDDAARLACFDAEVRALRGAEAAGEFRAIDRGAVAQIQKESFGFSLPSLPRLAFPKLGGREDSGPKAQSYTVTRIIAGEKPVFIMSDGTVWRVTEAERHRHIKVGSTVTVERAAMGSFLLFLPKGGGPSLRVRREE